MKMREGEREEGEAEEDKEKKTGNHTRRLNEVYKVKRRKRKVKGKYERKSHTKTNEKKKGEKEEDKENKRRKHMKRPDEVYKEKRRRMKRVQGKRREKITHKH